MVRAISRRTRSAFVWVVAIPVALGLLNLWAAARHRNSFAWVSHTKDVMIALEDFTTTINDAESSQRGFLLTGDESYRVRYAEKRGGLYGKIAVVRRLTADNPAQQANVVRLFPVVVDRLRVMEQTMALRELQRSDLMIATAIRRGTVLMSDIRKICDAMATEENRLLAERLRAQLRTQIDVGDCFVLGTLMSLGLLYYAHRVINAYGNDRDLAETELRALNTELERRIQERTADLKAMNEELTRSNQDLTRFAYVASHDLQEPLRTVASYAELLGMRYTGKLDARADKYIGFIVKGAKRMQALIQDLLAYSRLGKQLLQIQPVDVEATLQAVKENLRIAILERRARITHNPLPWLNADPGRLVQLVQNLIGNALKFAKSHESPALHISCWRIDDEWLFSIRDNGIGFDPQYAERIFVLFQRLHPVGAYQGTGMGLAICRRIVELHGGRIWAESELGIGSTFFFTLSARLEPCEDETPAPERLELSETAGRRESQA